MAENVVINDTTYNGVDTLALVRADGSVATFYPDAVRYNAQTLTEEQKEQARENIGIQEPLIGSTENITPNQVLEAVQAGRNILLGHTDNAYGPMGFTSFGYVEALRVVVSSGVQEYALEDGTITIVRLSLAGNLDDNNWYSAHGQLADYGDIPTKLSQLTNDKGFITGYTETDPTVPAWAKQTSKPSYTKSEVGLGSVENVKQYSANNPPPYPVTSVNGKTGAVTLDAAAVGARPSSWMPTAEDIANSLGYVPVGGGTDSPLTGKKIVYDGDSICAAAFSYPKLIADKTACIYDNQAVGGARLCAVSDKHSVVNNLANLPTDGDIYCFQGGINDWWGNTPLGSYTKGDYTGTLDPATIYGAMETICRYALTNFFGKAICFVITHKVQNAAYSANTAGNTFWDYREAMINVCEKYSIPYYDAFTKSGLNGWHTGQKAGLFVSGDGTHPTEQAYEAYYVPQLIDLFESIVPIGDYEAPAKPVTYTNALKNSVDSDGQPYNGGKGYKEDTYMNGSTTEASSTNYDVTGFIACRIGDIVRFKNVQVCKLVGSNTKCQIHYYDSTFARVSNSDYLKTPSSLSSAWNVVTNDDGTDIVQFTLPTALSASIRYIRMTCGMLTDASVITINEEID